MRLLSWLHERLTGRPRPRIAPTRKSAPRVHPHLEELEPRIVPSTVTVTNNLDSGAGSLRAEITAAIPGDTVNFASGLTGQTIKLTSGQLVINKSLTIQGLGADQLAISGGNTSRVFEVYGGTTNVTLIGLTITQGNGRGNLDPNEGGGIVNTNGSTLTVSGCTLSNNRAIDYGGGIYNSGATLNVVNSTLSGNSVNNPGSGGGEGGGVYSVVGTVSMTDCTLTHNTAGFEGGGVWIVGTRMTISGSTLSGNTARVAGGAIYNGAASASTLTVNDCVFSANSSTYFSPPITGPWTNGGGDIFN